MKIFGWYTDTDFALLGNSRRPGQWPITEGAGKKSPDLITLHSPQRKNAPTYCQPAAAEMSAPLSLPCSDF